MRCLSSARFRASDTPAISALKPSNASHSAQAASSRRASTRRRVLSSTCLDLTSIVLCRVFLLNSSRSSLQFSLQNGSKNDRYGSFNVLSIACMHLLQPVGAAGWQNIASERIILPQSYQTLVHLEGAIKR